MAERMTCDCHRFPTAVSVSLRLQTGFLPKAAQQSIRVESEEIRGVADHRVFEGSVEEAHVFDRWWHLGTARDGDELAALAETRTEIGFDPDVYGILQSGGLSMTRQYDFPASKTDLVLQLWER